MAISDSPALARARRGHRDLMKVPAGPRSRTEHPHLAAFSLADLDPGPGVPWNSGMTDVLATLQDQSFARATAATARSYPPGRRLNGGQLADYLGRRAFAVIGSSRPDGRPHAAMSSFIRRGTAFWLPTAGRVGARAQRAPPALADPDGHRRGRNIRTSRKSYVRAVPADRAGVRAVIPAGVASDSRACAGCQVPLAVLGRRQIPALASTPARCRGPASP
jgi:hypothetical protein